MNAIGLRVHWYGKYGDFHTGTLLCRHRTDYPGGPYYQVQEDDDGKYPGFKWLLLPHEFI